MREILYRGKWKNSSEWVYGNLFTPDKADTPTQICIGTYIARTCYEIDPETVGQYTGLIDRNGRKIFEGDIVAGTAYSIEWIGVIVWIDEIATFGVRYHHRTDPTAWENSSILKAVSCGREDKFAALVIGNIYDNPELLG